LALHWFRKHHKRLLLPLAAIVILTFVILGGPAGGPGGSGYEGGWVKIGDETIGARQLASYRRALLVITRAQRRQPGELAHLYYLIRAELAERAGIRVSTEQVREAIRAIMSAPGLLGTTDFTNSEYRARLNDLRVMPAVFEEFVRRFIAAETLKYVMQSAGYLGGEELKLAFRLEKDRVRLRVKDFRAADFVKEVEAPTDEEIAKYYEEHKDLPLDDDLALATEPEVSIEYAFVEKRGAEALAKSLRRLDGEVRFEPLLGGPGAALAGRLAAATLEADYEDRVVNIYELEKGFRYKLPPPKPKDAPKAAPGDKEKKGKKKEGKKQGVVETGGAGLASMIVLPALAAPAPEEPAPEAPEPETPATPAEPAAAAAAEEPVEEPAAEPEPPEELFRPLEEVRDQVERSVGTRLFSDAASRSVRRFQDIVAEHERLRTVGAEALGAGLALGGLPALEGAAGTPGRFDVLRACEEAGAVHGVTPLAKPDALKRMPRLGLLKSIPDTAVSRAASGTGDEWSGPSTVGRGSVVWRVADYVEPRLLEPEEAKETVRKRIVHERAADLAAKAAEEFRRDLQRGEVGVAEMTLTPPLEASNAKVQPFAALGVAEVAPEAVAVGKERDARVDVVVERRAAEIARILEEAGVGDERAVIVEIAERLAAETRAWETALYRVAVPVERVEPGHGQYAAWRGREYPPWRGRRTPQMLSRMREAFMVEVWDDLAADEVDYEESPEFTEWRRRLREAR
jgi:hypothetical protein